MYFDQIKIKISHLKLTEECIFNTHLYIISLIYYNTNEYIRLFLYVLITSNFFFICACSFRSVSKGAIALRTICRRFSLET